VTDVTADSITLQLANGGTITVGISGSTTHQQQEASSASSVSTGQNVIVELAGGCGLGGPSRGPAPSGAWGTSGAPAFGTARDITIASP
jgi:hypothetical protein